MGGASHVHAGIVQHQVTGIYQVAPEEKSSHRLGHVAAGLPSGREA
jgi:hypothetical protein